MSLPLYASFIDGKTLDNAPSAFDLVTPYDGNVIGRIAETGREGAGLERRSCCL
jgi:hypothetical protein